MQYDEAQQLQGRHRPENGCREKGTYMWETDAVPLSRFGEVEWFHQVYLMSEGEPLNSLGDIRVGRNADCEDDEYIVAVSGACPAPVDLETARFVESWAVKIPISDDQLQVIKRIEYVLVSRAWRDSCDYLLSAMARDWHFLDTFLYEVEMGLWDDRARIGQQPQAQAA